MFIQSFCWDYISIHECHVTIPVDVETIGAFGDGADEMFRRALKTDLFRRSYSDACHWTPLNEHHSKRDSGPAGFLELALPWNSCMMMMFFELGRRIAALTGERRAMECLPQRLSVAIQRGNAASVRDCGRWVTHMTRILMQFIICNSYNSQFSISYGLPSVITLFVFYSCSSVFFSP